jgi:RHS repeat-associated protein
MPLASSWLDLVVGADIHIELVPTPAGPVPTPFPHPFIGLVGDPAGAVVSEVQTATVSLATGGLIGCVSGKTLINGLPAATTSTVAKNTPTLLHVPLPPGAAFQKPPAGEAKLPLGSLTVTIGGANAVRGADPALSCSDPVPLLTSSVVALPKGPPVEIGGAPGINPANAIHNLISGALVRTVWGAGSALFKYIGRLNPTRLRNLIPKAKCFFTGHPVDVATGRVMSWSTDFTLPGPIPIVFSRDYASSWASRSGPLGPGWSHSLDRALWLEPRKIVARIADGREIVFDTTDEPDGELAAGAEIEDPVSKFVVKRLDGHHWRLVSPEGLVDELEPLAGDAQDAADRWGVARVVRTTDRSGDAEIVYTYDDRAHLVAVRDSGGRPVRLENDGAGRLARVLLPDPDTPDRWAPAVEFAYSEDGDLIAARDALGNVTRYAYDAHLMVQESDRNGQSFYWIYDGRSSYSRCVRTWGDGGIYDNVIDYGPRFSTVTDSYGKTTLYRINELDTVIEIRDPHGKSRTFEYDGALNVIAERDQLGRVTRTDHDVHGRPSIIRTPDGRGVAWRHHRELPELATLYQDQRGSIWRWSYDRLGRLSSLRNPLGDMTLFEWTRGLLAAVTEPGDRRTEHEHDEYGNRVLTRWPNGAEIRREFDRRGRVRAIIGPGDARTTIQYDLLNRIVEAAESGATGTVRTFAYDAEGNVLEIADQARRLRFTYGGFNWLVSREEGSDTIRYRHDLEGRLVEIKNERGQPYTFEYDACGRLAREIGFDISEKRYVRDVAGRVTEIHGPSGATKLSYDDADQLTEIHYADGSKASYGYREDGALVAAINDAVAVTFERDALGRVLCETQGDHRVTSTYAPSGERQTMESTLGARMAIQPDALGNPEALFLGPPDDPRRRREIRFARDPSGLEVERSVPGTLACRTERDTTGRLTAQHVRTEVSGWARAYTWQPGDRLAAIADSRLGQTTYHHDARARLVSAELPGGSVQHRAFDELGNIYRTPDRSDRRYLRGGAIRHDGATQFAFDRAGNQAARIEPRADAEPAITRYEWSGAGMLRTVARPDGTTVEYVYDAMGRRIRKKVGAVETRYAWDGDVLLHEMTAAAEPITWYYAPETFEPLARFDGERWHHVVTDQVGAPLAVYADDGTPNWEGQMDIYGSLAPVPADPLCPWRWPGQYEDDDTGLSLNLWRYYDTVLGQYISRDPIGIAGGLALYAYVDDPLSTIDPYGLLPWKPLGPAGVGHHLVPRVKANSVRGLEDLGTLTGTPTFYPNPSQPLMHERLHRAMRPHIGRIQGPWRGSPADLFTAVRAGLRSVSDVRGDLRLPGGPVLARNVTPEEAFDRLIEWHEQRGCNK